VRVVPAGHNGLAAARLGGQLSLLVRINRTFVVVLAVGATITGITCHAVVQANAEREIRAAAGLMMDSALAVRACMASESEQDRCAFINACRRFPPRRS
jgi:hypothetical protein